ncbi:MAG TPA: YcgN family cysteine cluster protein [Lichenihabitans sp.]|nr:YcgN family cysteine cluster protein [Lichenihabitans sp.]
MTQVHDSTPHLAGADAGDEAPFWRKPLAVLTEAEWESLCDGCGRCCLVKLEDEDTADIHFTDVTCRLLDASACTCGNYGDRQTLVPDCVKLTPELVQTVSWLPPTCAYRLVDEGRDLMWWHPLVSGDPDTVHTAGISVRGRGTVSEEDIAIEDLPGRIASWPKRWPKTARRSPVQRRTADLKASSGRRASSDRDRARSPE